MRIRLLFLCASLSWASGTNSAVFSAGQSGSVTLSGAPYSTQANFRVEERFIAWANVTSTNRSYWSYKSGNIFLRLFNSPTPLFQVLDFVDGPTGGSALSIVPPNLTGADFVMRIQRDNTNSLAACVVGASACMTIEVWNTDGTGYANNTIALTTITTGLLGGFQTGDNILSDGTIGFHRLYSTLVPLGSTMPYAGATAVTPADLADYEFANNAGVASGSDTSGHANTLIWSPSAPAYAAAPSTPPVCVIPPQKSFSAAAGTTLDFTQSVPWDGSLTMAAYTSSQINELLPFVGQVPPSTLTFSPSSSTPTFTGFVAGSYTIQLLVTQGAGGAGNTATCHQKYGAVNTDSSGNVIISNAVHAGILGPMVMTSNNPWTGYEKAGNDHGSLIIQKLQNLATLPFEFVDWWNTAQAGTVAVSSTVNPTTIVGTSTVFSTAVCQGPTHPVVPKYPTIYNSGWTNLSGNVWQLGVSSGIANPISINFNDTVGTLVGSLGAVTAPNQWFWSGGVLSVFSSGGNPASAYTAPGITTAGGSKIVIWDVIQGGLPGGSGRRIMPVASCVDDTHITVSNAYYGSGTPGWTCDTYILCNASGLQYAYVDDTEAVPSAPGGIGGWETGAYPGNYYDNVTALYSRYYQTGIDDFLYYARVLADAWFNAPFIDKGRSYDGNWNNLAWPNRSTAQMGLFLRNADSPPFDMSPGLRIMTNYWFIAGGCGAVGPGSPVSLACIDVREDSYSAMFVAMDALYNSCPGCTTPSSSQVTTDVQKISLDMANRWTANKQNGVSCGSPCNYWYIGEVIGSAYASWTSGFTSTVTPGSPTVTPQAGHTYDCTNFIAPGSFAPPVFGGSNYPNAIQFTNSGTVMPLSNSPFDAAWYYVQCNGGGTSLTLLTWNGSAYVATNYIGSLGAGAGWETGEGPMGYFSQPFMVGIQSKMFYTVKQMYDTYTAAFNALGDVTTGANAATYIQGNANWQAARGINYTTQTSNDMTFTGPTNGLYYIREGPNCEPITNQYPFCDSGLDGDRILNAEGLNAFTFATRLFPAVTAFKTAGDLMMGANFACAGGQPGFSGYCELPVIQGPSGFFYTVQSQHKWWGYFWGVGANWGWAAVRNFLGTATPAGVISSKVVVGSRTVVH